MKLPTCEKKAKIQKTKPRQTAMVLFSCRLQAVSYKFGVGWNADYHDNLCSIQPGIYGSQSNFSNNNGHELLAF